MYPCDQDNEVECAFCHGVSSDQEMRKKCGPLYGPIKLKKPKSSQLTFVHELCALWTPEVWLNDQCKFKDLQLAIDRASRHKCSICSDKGAGLGCQVEECKNTYHYLCAKSSGCLLITEHWQMYCPDHME